jgi:hypothetical protein
MRYSKGIMWLDDCRIPFVDDGLKQHIEKYGNGYGGNGQSMFNTDKTTKIYGDTKGRFTPNLLVCDDMLNDGSVGVSSKSLWKGFSSPNSNEGWQRNSHNEMIDGGYNDKGTNSRYYDLDKWFDKIVDEIQ